MAGVARASADSADRRSPVILGKISGQHGVKGWLKVYSYTRPAAQILEYRRWMLADAPVDSHRQWDWQPVEVAKVRRQAKKLLVKLAGVDDCNAAEALAGRWIAVQPSQFPPLPKGEYYWRDLNGLAVVNQDGVELGVVDHLVETGANDVLAVRPRHAGASGASGESGERLLPWSPEVIVAVDIAGGHIRVEWHLDD